jgi:hypothetical protein
MTNCKCTVSKDMVLTITVNLKESGKLSGSGKSEVIATTGAPTALEGYPDFKLGLNVFKAAKKA